MRNLSTGVAMSESFRSVLRGIVDDTAGDHSLGAMATRAGVSVRHLNRLFVEHMEITPARYVERARVAAAKKLLRRSSAPLAAVASRTGFGSVETMRRAFRRAGHGTPGAHRHRIEGPTLREP
jgi:transcriptional regulator GlxA family with amidase domain